MTLLTEIKEQPKQAITPMPSQEQDSGGQVLEFTGLDLREKAGSGAYLACENVSTRNYPCLSPRLGRGYAADAEYQGVDDLYRFDGRTIYRDGTRLWYDPDGKTPRCVGNVANSRKSFAVVNTKLVIYPDALCLDLATGKLTPLEIDITVTNAALVDGRKITGTFPHATVMKAEDMSSVPSVELVIPYYETEAGAQAADETEQKFYVMQATSSAPYTSLVGKWVVPALDPETGYAFRRGWLAGYRVQDIAEKTTDGVYGKITAIEREQDERDYWFYTVTVELYLNGIGGYTDIRAGDVVFISGLMDGTGSDAEEVDEFATRVWEATPTSVTVDTGRLTGVYLTTAKTVRIRRKVPALDYICANSNRVWGVSNAVENQIMDDDGNPVTFNGRAIFCSKLGDPGNWYYYQSVNGTYVSMDSWTAAVASEGDFTGICVWSDDILCFKESELIRVTGSVPSAYTMYSFSVPGVEQGSGGSIAVIDEAVYYKSPRGIYRYSGGTPIRVSENVSESLTGTGNAGTDGRNYFLSVPGGFFVYDTWHNAWVRHDGAVGRFAWDGSVALFLRDSDRSVSRVDAGNADGMAWGATLHPDYCTHQSGYYSVTLNISYKYFRYVFLRGEIFNKSGRTTITKKNAQGETVTVPYVPYVRVHAKLGDKEEEMIGEQSGVGKFLLRMPVTKYREDCIRIRLEGLGDCLLRDIRYTYSTGSEWVQSDKGVM